MKRRILGLVTAAGLALSSVPAAFAETEPRTLQVGNGMYQYRGVDDEGYTYEIWIDAAQEGTGSMTLGPRGTCETEWNASVSRGDFIASRGLNFGDGLQATTGSFSAEYTALYDSASGTAGNSQLCFYGWLRNEPTEEDTAGVAEYFIIEDWKDWCPWGADDAQTVTIDGCQYRIFRQKHVGPSIDGACTEFWQYYSVRQQKRTTGHVSLTEHFKAWEDAGWNVGALLNTELYVQAWECSGRFDISKLDFSMWGVKPVEKDEEEIDETEDIIVNETTVPGIPCPIEEETAFVPVGEDGSIEEPAEQPEAKSKTQKIGDADENGKITVGDAVLLARFCANDSTVSEDITAAGLANADVDQDGNITPADLTLLLRALANFTAL